MPKRLDNATKYKRSAKELAWQKTIVEGAMYLGYKVHHETDSRRSNPGFPDLIMVGRGHTVYIECKTETGPIRAEQQEWLDHLLANGQIAMIARPSDWPRVEATLKNPSGFVESQNVVK